MGLSLKYSAPNPPFLASHPTQHPQVILLGAPLDCTETFRPGTAAAPQRIRAVSDSIESYSHVLDRDLEDLRFVDRGDLALSELDLDAALEEIRRATEEQSAAGGLVVLLGGEHTLTLSGTRALHARHPDLAVLHLDAHLDMIQEYDGLRVAHGTVFRRIADELGLGQIVQLGVRSGTRQEFRDATQCRYSSPALSLPRHIFDWLSERPVYLSLDIDVLDPAHAPGVGNPEAGGPTFSELLSLLYSLRSLHVVGLDLVEVLPNIDHGDNTSVAAAKLLREMILAFAR